MQFLMATAGLSVPSIRSSIGFTTWFCAEHLHHSIAKSVNESPYKSSLLKRSSSDSSSAPGKIPSSFLREMDIINGFQLCDRSYRDVSLRGCRSPSLFSPDDGSTVVSVFLHKARRQLITAHVGDARAAQSERGKLFGQGGGIARPRRLIDVRPAGKLLRVVHGRPHRRWDGARDDAATENITSGNASASLSRSGTRTTASVW